MKSPRKFSNRTAMYWKIGFSMDVFFLIISISFPYYFCELKMETDDIILFFFFSFPDKILFLEKFKGKIWKAYIMLASLLKGAVLLLALVSRRFHSGNDEAICVLPESSLPQVLQQLCPCWSRSCSDTLPVPCKLWDDSMYSWGSFCAMCDKYVACKVILLGVFFFNIGWICYCGMCNPLVEKKKKTPLLYN